MEMVDRRVLITLLLCVVQFTAFGSVNRRTPVVEAVERVLPSVVNIGTERIVKVRYSDPFRRFRSGLIDRLFSEYFRPPPPPPGYSVGHSLGSGVIVDPHGYILTNYHVIERASRILVTLADESAYEARVVAGDEVSDLALIKIEPKAPLTAVAFAGDGDLYLGETVIALGNPFGLTHTVTVGVLSAKDRAATYEGEVLYRDILQTDAAVNPGSSGGPLLNLDGELMGINVAILPKSHGDIIKFVVERDGERHAVDIKLTAMPKPSGEILAREQLGIEFVEQETVGAQRTGRFRKGLSIAEVVEGGPAASIGLRSGFWITRINDSEIQTLDDVGMALEHVAEGDMVTVVVVHIEERESFIVAQSSSIRIRSN